MRLCRVCHRQRGKKANTVRCATARCGIKRGEEVQCCSMGIRGCLHGSRVVWSQEGIKLDLRGGVTTKKHGEGEKIRIRNHIKEAKS